MHGTFGEDSFLCIIPSQTVCMSVTHPCSVCLVDFAIMMCWNSSGHANDALVYGNTFSSVLFPSYACPVPVSMVTVNIFDGKMVWISNRTFGPDGVGTAAAVGLVARDYARKLPIHTRPSFQL